MDRTFAAVEKTKGDNMIPKYHIVYGMDYNGHRDAHVRDFETNDPVACEAFLVALLERGMKILAIKHEGVALEQKEFDVLVRNAATTLGSNSTCFGGATPYRVEPPAAKTTA